MEWSKYFSGSQSFEIYKHIFDDIEIWDAHTHIGTDEDGKTMIAKDLIRHMNAGNITKAVTFPLNDPRRGEDFHRPNEMILRAYRKYPRRLIPFFRLDPNGKWKKEFALRAGQNFRGIKLHPRSQRFNIQGDNVLEIYDKAQDENLEVLVHTGWGLDDVTGQIKSICRKFPRLHFILGHSAFVDLTNVIKYLKNRKNIFFDLSTLLPFDIYEMMQNTTTMKIMFGSDMPYYDADYHIELIIHLAVVLDTPMKQLEKIFSGNLKTCLE